MEFIRLTPIPQRISKSVATSTAPRNHAGVLQKTLTICDDVMGMLNSQQLSIMSAWNL